MKGRLTPPALAAAIVAATVIAGATRQARPADPQWVEFFVVSSDGTPVGDLRSNEVTLRVNGRTRPVATLEWVRAAPLPPGPEGQREAPLSPPFGSSLPEGAGRTVIIVIDDYSFRPGREHVVRDAVREMVSALGPRDRVALVTVPYGGLKVDFTVEHERLRTALLRIVGQAPQNETGSELACRSRRTLASLTGLLESLGGGMGPATVIFVSSALAGPRRDAPVTLAPGVCELTVDHFKHVGESASAARAHFYVVQPEDVAVPAGLLVENIAGTGFTGSDNPIEGLEHLSGVTGGHRLALLSSSDNNLLRVAREISGFYLVSFIPEASERNGRPVAVDVVVSRANATVRARPSVTVPRPSATATRRPSAREMLRQPPQQGLPLRAAAFPSLNDSKTVKLLGVLESFEPGVTFTEAVAGVFDDKGLVAQWTATSEELKSAQVLAALAVPPGRYRFRMAAVDASGRRGTADYLVDAELVQVGSLTMSGLVLGLSRGGFRPMLQFSREPVALAYLEFYGPIAAVPNVSIELAMSEDGPALVKVPAAVSQAADGSRRFGTAAIPIGAVPPGDYAVRATVTVEGAQARVVRTVRKR
jgi:VWFA-related protein